LPVGGGGNRFIGIAERVVASTSMVTGTPAWVLAVSLHRLPA
jgi:hypothetical protein